MPRPTASRVLAYPALGGQCLNSMPPCQTGIAVYTLLCSCTCPILTSLQPHYCTVLFILLMQYFISCSCYCIFIYIYILQCLVWYLSLVTLQGEIVRKHQSTNLIDQIFWQPMETRMKNKWLRIRKNVCHTCNQNIMAHITLAAKSLSRVTLLHYI